MAALYVVDLGKPGLVPRFDRGGPPLVVSESCRTWVVDSLEDSLDEVAQAEEGVYRQEHSSHSIGESQQIKLHGIWVITVAACQTCQ